MSDVLKLRGELDSSMTVRLGGAPDSNDTPIMGGRCVLDVVEGNANATLVIDRVAVGLLIAQLQKMHGVMR